jgi:hypothetical protein
MPIRTGAVIPAHQSFYSVTNDVVAFACDRADYGRHLTADHYGQLLADISGACGRYVAGAKETLGATYGGATIVGYQ